MPIWQKARLRMSDTNTPATPSTKTCEVCESPAKLIPYQDAAGCGTAVIELWRCENGHARYGDIMGYSTCDVNTDRE